jgi:hypothetical protein
MPSTSNLLQVINAALRSIGERPLLRLNGVLADVARDSLTQTARDIEGLHRWGFLVNRTPANSWSGAIAQLSDYLQLISVEVGQDSRGFRQLQYVTPQSMREIPIQPYTATNDSARFFTELGDFQVQLHPYPNDVVAQARVLFQYRVPIALPSVETDVFPNLPERFIPLFTKKLSYNLAVRHLADMGLAQQYQSEFEFAVQQYRNRENQTTGRALNMYRGYRRN